MFCSRSRIILSMALGPLGDCACQRELSSRGGRGWRVSEQASADDIGDRLHTRRGAKGGGQHRQGSTGTAALSLALAAWMLASWAFRPFWRSGPTARRTPGWSPGQRGQAGLGRGSRSLTVDYDGLVLHRLSARRVTRANLRTRTGSPVRVGELQRGSLPSCASRSVLQLLPSG